ncbi:MAG: YhgE/Pip domain-containing protein [Raoultibacter sp.]
MAFKGLRFAGLEVKNITASAAMKVVLAAIGIIPLLYGALYLYAFMDPYVQLNTVPVAVVNEDAGAAIDDEQRNVGNEVIDELKNNDDGLGWHFVSADEARRGMDNGTYYMACTIPSGFSENIASVDTKDPEHAQLMVEYNQSKNMLASQIGATVWDRVRQQVSDTVAKQYWETVLTRTSEAGDSLQTASRGAGDLQTGITTAQEGSATLTDKLGTLSGGAATLKEGTSSLSAGAQALKGGTTQLEQGATSVSSGAQKLQNEGTSKVSAGANQLAQATAALPDEAQVEQLDAASHRIKGALSSVSAGIGGEGDAGSETLYGGLNQLDAGVGSSSDQAPTTLYGLLNLAQATNTAGDSACAAGEKATAAGESAAAAEAYATARAYYAKSQQLVAGALQATGQISSGVSRETMGLSQLSGGVDAVAAGYTTLSDLTAPLITNAPSLKAAVAQLSTGASQVNENMTTLVSGAGALSSGASQVDAGVSTAVSGASQLDAGAGQIASGAPQLQKGSKTLTDGLQAAIDGAGELSTKLADGAGEMKLSQSEIDAKSEVMSDPVQIGDEYYTTVKNYGTGFAPYFMALGLWVGALVASFAFKPLNKRLIVSGGNPVMVAFANFMPLAGIAIVQALLLLVCLQFGLQLQIDNVPLYYAFGLLTTLVFAAILQFLMAAFAFPGRFIAIILLMLQLTSAAGTFPIETTPEFFQVVSPYMPMTYVVAGMREIMTGIDLSVAGFDALVLLLFGVVSFALTVWVAYRKRMVRMEDLHPILHLG